MKYLLLPSFLFFGFRSLCQNVQLVYDSRHYPTLYFEYFKSQDSGHSLIKPGSFLFKMEADGYAPGTNTAKMYFQVSQTLRCWTPKIFLHLSLSGGLGVTEPKQYSYYIVNTYMAGAALPFQWKGGYYSAVLDYKYVPYTRASSDLLWTFYFYKGFLHYRAEFLGDFSVWTENKNHGDPETEGFHGKRIFFFAEPQIWWRIVGGLSVGGRLNIYYHVNISDDTWQFYPAAGIRWKL
jgi:hypothetical protein